jgi:hypothetical protein
MEAMTPRPASVLVAALLGIGLPVIAPDPAAGQTLPERAVPERAVPERTVPERTVPERTVPELAAPGPVCRIGDDRLTELSGLAATGTGYVAVNDGSDEPDHRRIFYLDGRCSVVRTVAYPSRPRDTEDLALAADGTVWVADIGDNSETRETIGLWRLAAGSKKPKLYRLTYPDGPHNAEALLLTRDGTPIVVTKTPGAASLYVPAAELDDDKKTPLRRAGDVTVPVTTTANPFGFPGRLVITGGAVSPDGRHATLRTYADAFEYDVPAGGDLVRAITDGTPRTVALPDEPQGESIAYSADGAALLTVSEESGKRPVELLRYPLPDRPAATASAPEPEPAASASPAAPAAAAPRQAASDRTGIPAGALVTAGILTLAAAALVTVVALRRSRKRH